MERTILIVANRSFNLVRARLPLMKRLLEEGWSVHAAGKPHDNLEKELIENGIIFHPLDIQRATIAPIKDIKTIKEITNVIDYIKPDIVHYFNTKSILLGGFVPSKEYITFISMTGLEFTHDTLKNKIVRFVLKFPMMRAKKIFFETREDKDFCEKYGLSSPEKSQITIASGVDLKLFEFCKSLEEKDTTIIFFAGRLVETKGIRELLEAATRLKEKYGNKVVIRLAGEVEKDHVDGFNVKKLAPYINKDIIQYVGKLSSSEMIKNLEEIDIAVLPSYREGFSKFLMEASAAGKALIATDTPGCRNIVINNKTGLTIPAKDSDRLYIALKDLIENKKKRLRFGIDAREMAFSRFNQDDIAKTMIKTYMEIL